jgi:hypothetical protein
MVIHGASETFTSAVPAELKVTFGAAPTVSLTIQGLGVRGETWSAMAQLSRDQVMQAAATAKIETGPMSEGRVNLTLFANPAAPRLVGTDGTLRLSVGSGQISGVVQAQPAELSASFQGDVVVSCWIPRSGLGPQGGTTDPAGGEVLVQDNNLSSSLCAPFKTWQR